MKYGLAQAERCWSLHGLVEWRLSCSIHEAFSVALGFTVCNVRCQLGRVCKQVLPERI